MTLHQPRPADSPPEADWEVVRTAVMLRQDAARHGEHLGLEASVEQAHEFLSDIRVELGTAGLL